jgi:polyvinyl alcohol dehydrogenase (cytochrome)
MGSRYNVDDGQNRLIISLLCIATFFTLVATPIHAADHDTPSLHPDPRSLPTASPLAKGDAGQAVYQGRCAVCHDHPQEQIPPKSFLGTHTRDYIVNALTNGVMQAQATGLSVGEIDAVATYLIDDVKSSMPAGAKVSQLEEPDLHANSCKRPAPRFALGVNDWNGFSPAADNARFQRRPGLRVADISKLKPKWVFAYPEAMAYGSPSVVANRVFISTVTGSVLSLDSKTGCTYWVTEPGAKVRTPVLVGKLAADHRMSSSQPHFAAYFGDAKATVHAINAETGELLWLMKVDEHAFASISGAPELHQGKLYVPLTSGEGSMGPHGNYPCCTFRGSIVALDARTGEILWKSYTITEAPKPFKLNAAGTQMYAPAGVGIWSALTVDVKRGSVYGTTAESKTALSVDTSDAIMAFDLDTGARRWVTQATSNDNWIQGCEGKIPGANCPDPLGNDADFDTPAMLLTSRSGRQILVAAQKSGLVTAVDPDAAGKITWQRNLAQEAEVPSGKILRDRALPGVVYGMAADDSKVYAAIADPSTDKGHIPLGVYALNFSDGNIVWHTPGAPVPSCTWGDLGCTGAQHTAVTLIPGAVFAGSANGHILSYATDDGRVIWDFDTAHSYTAVNGVTAQGGSIERVATVVAGGTLYVMSGYASYGGGRGNALIAFTVDGK